MIHSIFDGVVDPDGIDAGFSGLHLQLGEVDPGFEVQELLGQMRMEGIEPKFMRSIHSQLDTEAKLILVDGVKGARPGIRLGPPLIIYDVNGEYSKEVQGMFTP